MRGVFSISGLVLSAILLVGCGPSEEKPKNMGSAGNNSGAMKCINMALDGKGSPSLVLFNAVNAFMTEVVNDVVAVCRRSLSEFPNDKRLIISNFQATYAITVLALESAEIKDGEIVPPKSIVQLENETSSATSMMNVGFYIASAYEYGIGAPQSKQEAEKWYAKAAAAGDKIAERELGRLQGK